MPFLWFLLIHNINSKQDHEATESMLHLNDRCFYSCFLDNTQPVMPKASLGSVFFCDVNHNLKKWHFLRFLAFTFQRTSQETKGRGLFVICDWWISIPFVCFCVSRFIALFLKSTVSFTLVLSFFNFFILKCCKFRFQR